MLNQCVFMGRFTKDPELRYTTSGTACASFSLAVERDFADSNGNRNADFINFVAWRQKGEFISKNFVKGQMAVVVGRLSNRSWTDADGHKRSTSEINVEHIYFASKKPTASAPEPPPYDDSEVPCFGKAYDDFSDYEPYESSC